MLPQRGSLRFRLGRQETRRTELRGHQPDATHLRQHPLRCELMTPPRNLAHTPGNRRTRNPIHDHANAPFIALLAVSVAGPADQFGSVPGPDRSVSRTAPAGPASPLAAAGPLALG